MRDTATPMSVMTTTADTPTGWSSHLWRALGATSVAIGLVNAFIPLLPTTVFLLIGAWAYGKGSPDLQARLFAHPRYGAALRLWHEHRMLTRRAKILSTAGIFVSFLVTLFAIGPAVSTATIGIGLAGLALFLLTRPEPADALAGENRAAAVSRPQSRHAVSRSR
jgi:uncharacterized membrane protein YbaN (DUF454 family)